MKFRADNPAANASLGISQPMEEFDIRAAWERLPGSYAIPPKAASLAESFAYCERLTRGHYENFSVASWFLPRRLHQHFFNVYSYCRISDDLGDEVGDKHLSLLLLDAWEEELGRCYRHLEESPGIQGGPTHPVFVALTPTIREFGIPQEEFANLLKAFRQDQLISRYDRFEDLLGYCRNSADPVGHLVLYLGGYSDAERQRLSDHTCTALQLANFWQDVAVDFTKDRIYLPLEDLRRFNVQESDIATRRPSAEFREMMRFEVERARKWFELGLPLVEMVDKELALDLELFTRGGQEILNAVEKQGFDVLSKRPVISKPRKLWLLLRAVAGKLR